MVVVVDINCGLRNKFMFTQGRLVFVFKGLVCIFAFLCQFRSLWFSCWQFCWIWLFQYQAKRLARKSIAEMTYFSVEWDVKPCSIPYLKNCTANNMYTLPPIGEQSIVISVSCLYVCLSAIISLELHVRSSPNFLCMLPMAVAWPSCGHIDCVVIVTYFQFYG